MAIPPAVVPLALSIFVAMAGPGGVVDVGDSGEPTGTGAVPPGVSFGGSTEGSAGSDGGDADDGDDADGGSGGDVSGASVVEGDGKGCEEALDDWAMSRDRLEEHVGDEDWPEGGVNGNQNALDHQCGGAFAAESDGTADESADPVGTEPGKSEQAPGGPEASGEANGQGQANADAQGNGVEGAPGKNKP